MALTSLFIEKSSGLAAERIGGRGEAVLVAPGMWGAGISAAALFGLVVAPRGASLWLALICLGLWCASSTRSRLLTWSLSAAPSRVAIAIAAVLMLAGMLSPDPANGAWSALGVSGALLMTVIAAVGIIDENDGAWCGFAGRLGAHAIFIGGLFVLADLLSNQAVLTAIVDRFPILVGSSLRHVKIDGERIVGVYGYVLNRNVGVLNLVAWPALAFYAAQVQALRVPRGERAILWGFALTVLAATFLSDHESSKVALVAATVVFMLARWVPRGALQLVRAGWIVACLLVVPITQLAYAVHLENVELLPKSARGRVINWHNISNYVGEAPVLGIGLDATRYYSDLARQPQQCGDLCLRETWRHPHNVYLQIWYELGAVGVAIFMACGLALLRLVSRVPQALKPFALAAFTSAATIIAFSWSIWQLWFFSAMAVGVLLLVLAYSAGRAAGRSGGTGSRAPSHQ